MTPITPTGAIRQTVSTLPLEWVYSTPHRHHQEPVVMLINVPLSTAHSSAIVAAKAVEYGLRLVRYDMRDAVWIAEVHGGTTGAQRGIMALAEYFQTHVYAVDAARPEGTPSHHPRDARRDWIMQHLGGAES